MSMAKLVDLHADVIIVGDSVGMVLYGMPNTLGVTLDMMIAHGKAVVRGSARACIVVDLPFGSYQESPSQAFRSAARLLRETGAQAVKIEGGAEMVETVRFLRERGVPVMAHVGLMPQHMNTMGGFKAQGLTGAAAEKILSDALVLERAGAFAILIEGTAEALARRITEELTIPTIGIGASPACDGQVLVTEDMLGMFTEYTPKFVKRYADLSGLMSDAIAQYADDVRENTFPEATHCFAYGKPELISANQRSELES
jgi:3-methyl-2-oxobutanoate hydroxymethyltransferase